MPSQYIVDSLVGVRFSLKARYAIYEEQKVVEAKKSAESKARFERALAAKRAKKLPKSPTWAFCYDMLNRVSRSFAIVIQQLPEELRNAVCVF